MQLEGIHHVTCITGDAPRNVEFYAGTLGLRLVKKTVNQDDPTVYHLFYADEQGSPGSDITFFEYPGARRRAARARGWCISSAGASARDGRARLLGRAAGGRRNGRVAREDGTLRFSDPEGLGHELAVVETDDEPLVAEHPEVPRELALQGFDGVRAYSAEPERSRSFLEEALGFEPIGRARVGGARRAPRRHLRLRHRPASEASAEPARSTTSPGPRRWRTTRPGASGPPRRARRRRR